MASVTIRNLDDDVVAKLKARAKANHRSLEAELRQLLSVAATSPSTANFLEFADRIAALTPDVPQMDSVELLREVRDER